MIIYIIHTDKYIALETYDCELAKKRCIYGKNYDFNYKITIFNDYNKNIIERGQDPCVIFNLD